MPLEHVDCSIRIFNGFGDKAKGMVTPPLLPLLLESVDDQLVDLLLLHCNYYKLFKSSREFKIDSCIHQYSFQQIHMKLSFLFFLPHSNQLVQGHQHLPLALVLVYQSLTTSPAVRHPNTRQVLHNAFVKRHVALKMSVGVQLSQNGNCPFVCLELNLAKVKKPEVLEKRIGNGDSAIDDQMQIISLPDKLQSFFYFLLAL